MNKKNIDNKIKENEEEIIELNSSSRISDKNKTELADTVEEAVEEEVEDAVEEEVEEKTNVLTNVVNSIALSNVLTNIVDIFSTSKNKELKNKEEEHHVEYTKNNKVRIKDGVLYAETIDDIISSGIKPVKNNLLIILPHTVHIDENNTREVKLSYLKHNGDWWVNLGDNINKDESQLEFEPVIISE